MNGTRFHGKQVHAIDFGPQLPDATEDTDV